LTPLILKEATQKGEWLSLSVSFVGIVVLYSDSAGLESDHDLLGVTLGVVSGFFYALTMILYKVILGRGLRIRTVNFWRYGISTMTLLPFVSLLGISEIHSSDLIPLVGFGALFAIVASGIRALGIIRTRALRASILGKTEPVFAILLALVVLNEIPSIEAVIGGVLIIGSSVWLTLRKEAPGTIPAPPSLGRTGSEQA
ncbi:MAG: DMT family transporter, partial [Mycobacteriales bacterium]